jgi:FeS assembly protein IscX
MRLTWNDPRGIGEQLYEDHEDVDPLSVSFVQLHKWICALENFGDDPKASSEGSLEAVQMIWYEEWKFDNE